MRSSLLRRTLGRIRTVVTDDRGYAAVMTSLILIPLMGFAGFAVDVGAWYSRAASLQRAADAAALSGVVWQPDFLMADPAARGIALQNGFADAVDGIEVHVTALGSNKLEVEIVDTNVDMYFAGLFLDNVTISRTAVAEYAEPLPMGSPANVMGFGTESLNGEAPSNAWSAMMGHCTDRDYGDLLSITSVDDNSNSNGNCGTRNSNPYHDKSGYEWIVEIPTANAVDINVYDYGACRNSDRPTAIAQNDDYNNPVRYTLYAPDATPLTFDDNPQYGASVVGNGTFGCGIWSTLWTTNGTTGLWMVRTEILDTDGDQTYDTFPQDEGGVNYFAFWADSAASATTYCVTFTDPNCPGVYANEWMPVRTDPPLGQPAIFYLAEIDVQHQDKILLVRLWDAGENMVSMEILDPNGNAVDFTYTTPYYVMGSPSGGPAAPCALSSYCLDVTGSVFNGQLVEIEVPLSGLSWGTFPNYWFRVRYNLGATASVDWTTWGVEVIGDPVRLLE